MRQSGHLAGATLGLFLGFALALPVIFVSLLLLSDPFQPTLARWLLLVAVLLPEAVALSFAFPRLEGEMAAGVSALALGMAWKVVSLAVAISNVPLSLGWSEASRYYYASLFSALSCMECRRPFLCSIRAATCFSPFRS